MPLHDAHTTLCAFQRTREADETTQTKKNTQDHTKAPKQAKKSLLVLKICF